jgi:hypothetical protein
MLLLAIEGRAGIGAKMAPELQSPLADGRRVMMMVVSGLAVFVVICLLLSMMHTPPAVGK